MAVFQAKDITVRTEFLEGAGPGKILEIEFKGTHNHLWPPEGRPTEFINGEVRTLQPAALLFNFSGYHYTFGNEIGGAIISPAMAMRPKLIKHWAIVASGITGARLRSLFAGSNLEKVFNFGFFEDVESGRAFLRRALESEPSTPPAR